MAPSFLYPQTKSNNDGCVLKWEECSFHCQIKCIVELSYSITGLIKFLLTTSKEKLWVCSHHQCSHSLDPYMVSSNNTGELIRIGFGLQWHQVISISYMLLHHLWRFISSWCGTIYPCLFVCRIL